MRVMAAVVSPIQADVIESRLRRTLLTNAGYFTATFVSVIDACLS